MRRKTKARPAVKPEHVAELATLVRSLSSQRTSQREAAAERLVEFGATATPAIPAMIEALNDSSQITQGWACRALANIGRPAVPALIKALRNRSRFVRYRAAIALGWIGQDATSAIPQLVRALGDNNKHNGRAVSWNTGQVASAAGVALGAMGHVAVRPLITVLRRRTTKPFIENVVTDSLRTIGRPAVPALVPLLQSRDGRTRRRAAHALRKLSADAIGALPALIRALHDRDVIVRSNTLSTIGHIGPAAKRAAPIVAHLVEDRDRFVRQAAVQTLGALGVRDRTVVDALVRRIDDAEQMVVCSAGSALVALGIRRPELARRIAARAQRFANDEDPVEMELREIAKKLE